MQQEALSAGPALIIGQFDKVSDHRTSKIDRPGITFDFLQLREEIHRRLRSELWTGVDSRRAAASPSTSSSADTSRLAKEVLISIPAEPTNGEKS